MADISINIKAQFEQAEKAFNAVADLSDKAREKVERFAEGFKSEQMDRFIERNGRLGAAVTATKGTVAGMEAQYKSLQREIERLINAGMSPQSEHLQKLTSQYDKLGKELDNTKVKADKTGLSFGTLVKSLVGANLIERGLYAIGSGIKSIFTEAMKLEDAQAAFIPLMGGSAKAAELVKQLNIAAAETPFQFEGIQKAVSTLLPVMNGDITKTIETFKMLGDTAGGNQEKLESVTRGFTKAMLKGKVDMESLNMVAEAGVPIFTEMAASMGYGKENMTEFFKKIQSGTVSTDEMVKAFQRMTGEGGIFFEGMIIASKTTSGVMSTLRDNIAMTAAGIGQAFLPYLKEIALAVISVTSGILKWVNTEDNLKNTMTAIGYILAALASGFVAYNIATKAAAFSSGIFTTAIKAMTMAMAANPIGAIAAAITAILIPALIWVYNNWEKVKFAVVDFSQAAQIKMNEFALVIREKVLGAMLSLFDTLKNIPIIGKEFAKLTLSQAALVEGTKAHIKEIEKSRSANKAKYDEAVAQAEKEKAVMQGGVDAHVKANADKNKSDAERAKTLKEILDSITLSEQASNRQKIEEAAKFFDERAALEGETHEARLEYLAAQQEQIRSMNIADAEQRKQIEAGVVKAIQRENEKMTMMRLQFAQNTLSSAADLISSLQVIMKNAGKESRNLAIAFKALSVAEATVSAFLAFNKTLASFPAPYNMIAAGIVLAAGLAKATAIATTPIPSAQTGMRDYTVPDTARNRNDRAAVMASPGEQVTVTPRGESNDRTMQVNIQIEEDTLIRVIQRYVDTGKVNLTNRNIQSGVFAT